jgi:hypothetical protein
MYGGVEPNKMTNEEKQDNEEEEQKIIPLSEYLMLKRSSAEYQFEILCYLNSQTPAAKIIAELYPPKPLIQDVTLPDMPFSTQAYYNR